MKAKKKRRSNRVASDGGLERIDAGKLKGLREMARERNMVSDLIMDDSKLFLDCVFSMHDAHSFWASVRRAHKEMKRSNAEVSRDER